MFLVLIRFIESQSHFQVPLVFHYYSTRMLLAAATGLILTIFLGPRFIKKLYELKIGQSIRIEECPLLGKLHKKKENTPTMGGVLILFSVLCSLFLWMDLSHAFTLILFISSIFFGLIGICDDYLKLRFNNTLGISSLKKLVLQLVVSTVIPLYLLCPGVNQFVEESWGISAPFAKEYGKTSNHDVLSSQKSLQLSSSLKTHEFASRLYLPFFKKPIIVFKGKYLLFLLAFFMLFVITGTSNAVNLTDGLDGLASGVLIIVSIAFALIAFLSNHAKIAAYLNILYIEGSGEIGIFLCALIGSCLGFLWYNAPPAQVFMGDTGSLTLGGVLGVCAILLRRELLLALIGGVFVVETLSVVLQVGSYKLRNKKRIFLCSPLHHHFEYQGLAETKVVVRFWIMAFLCAIIGLFSLKFQ